MKFCNTCGRMLVMAANASTMLTFECAACGTAVLGTAADTLLTDEQLDTNDSNVQNATLIDNAPFDAANNRVKKQCPACKLPYMTLLILDDGARIVYKCSCGYQIN